MYPPLDDVAKKKGKGEQASGTCPLLCLGKESMNGMGWRVRGWSGGGDWGTEGLKQLKYMHPKYVRGGCRNSSWKGG